MNCNDIHELAPLYVSGELEPARAADFDAHLKQCSNCLHEIQEQSRLDARLRQALLAQDVDVERVNRRIREMMTAEPLTPVAVMVKGQATPRRRWVTAVIGAAAAFALAIAGYLLLPGKFSKVYADAAQDHQMEVIDHSPRHWYADPAQIVKLEQRFGMSVGFPQELAGGYHLEQGKICMLGGKLYLHLVYTDGVREFSLFLRPREGQRLTGSIRGVSRGRLLRASASGREYLASFATSHLVAIVATNLDTSTSLEDARLASAAIEN